MRLRHPDGSVVHLAYCTNVHPAETLDGVLAQLRDHCEPVRRRLGVDRLGVGLWLARDAVAELTADPTALGVLRAELDRRGLETVTLNGFPYRGFGDAEVKYRVYRPDWTEPARLEHTLALARLLAGLLPDDVAEGSVSTLPLAWRTGFDARAAAKAGTALDRLADGLDALERQTGRSIRVGLEPEPGCAVETTGDAVDALAGLAGVARGRVGVCVDTCHLATSFEEPEPAFAALRAAGIEVVKAQLSVALQTPEPHLATNRAALGAFVEPRFLHQTRTRTAAGLAGTDDLDEALAGGALPDGGPWRTHVHVPLHAPPSPPLSSTTDVLRGSLGRLVGENVPRTRHLEVETYTWQVLPPELRPRDRDGLADGIAAELAHARDLLVDLGLKELP